jgi:hypothetical protein
MDDRIEADADSPRNCMIFWKDTDGSARSAGPLSRTRAELLVKAYQEISPQRCYRVEPLPRELEMLQVGRIARHRRPAAHSV